MIPLILWQSSFKTFCHRVYRQNETDTHTHASTTKNTISFMEVIRSSVCFMKTLLYDSYRDMFAGVSSLSQCWAPCVLYITCCPNKDSYKELKSCLLLWEMLCFFNIVCCCNICTYTADPVFHVTSMLFPMNVKMSGWFTIGVNTRCIQTLVGTGLY